MSADALWIGLDLGQSRTHVCVIDDAGTTLEEQACETRIDALAELLSPYASRNIGLLAVEAGSDMYVVRKLRKRGYPVAIFEARKASKFLAIRRSKSDSSDARGLADLARLGRETVSQVHLKSVECQELRSQLVMRHKLVFLRVAADGALRSRLALFGRRLKCSPAPGMLRQQVRAQLDALFAEEGIDLNRQLLPLVDVCESLRAFLRQLDTELERLAKSHPVCRLLMEVPGVGPICSLSFFSAIEDPHRFGRAADVGGYLGLVPRRYQSGEVSRTRGITKSGNKLTRSHLVTAATVLRTRAPDCALKEWALALKERIGSARSKVALARKMAIIMLTMWKSGSHFEPFPRGSQRERQAGLRYDSGT